MRTLSPLCTYLTELNLYYFLRSCGTPFLPVRTSYVNLARIPSLLHFPFRPLSGNLPQLFSAESNNFRDDCRPCQISLNRAAAAAATTHPENASRGRERGGELPFQGPQRGEGGEGSPRTGPVEWAQAAGFQCGSVILRVPCPKYFLFGNFVWIRALGTPC